MESFTQASTLGSEGVAAKLKKTESHLYQWNEEINNSSLQKRTTQLKEFIRIHYFRALETN